VGRELAIDPATGLEPAIAQVLDLALVLAQVGEPVLAIVQAGVALELDLVKAELEHGLGVAGLELVLAVAELAQGHPPVQPAVALTTKSVTVAHRRGLVPLLAAEDLGVAAVETTRGPAAIEAATAWEAADIAVVVAGVVVVAVAVVAEAEAEAVAADGDEKSR
jgi:hypothetical protein